MFEDQFMVLVLGHIFRRDQISSIAIELTLATPKINKIIFRVNAWISTCSKGLTNHWLHPFMLISTNIIRFKKLRIFGLCYEAQIISYFFLNRVR